MRNRHLTLILASLTVCFSQTQVHAQDSPEFAAFALLEDAVTKAVEKAEPTIVAIANVRHSLRFQPRQPGRNPFNLDGRNRVQATNPNVSGFKPREFGTGIIVSNPDNPSERLILTNYHVVRGGRVTNPDSTTPSNSTLHVWLNRRLKTEATIFAADPRSDLAVLKFDVARLGLAPADIPAMRLPKDNRIRKGQFVIALGNPYAIASHDGSPSVSLGLVSNVSRFPFAETQEDKTTIHHFGSLLHVDTRLGPGSSGGALLNRNGELIGITTSLAALEGYESTVGYAIPVDRSTRHIIDALIHGFEVEYGFLGVRMSRSAPRVPFYGDRHLGPVGVEVESVMDDSPAQQGGIRGGDVLLSVNGKALFEQDDLFREIGLVPPGEIAHIRAHRNRREVPLKVRVGKWAVGGDGIVASATRFPVWRGLHVDWPTGRQSSFDPEKPYPRAVYVRKVDAGSASASQIESGRFIAFVNGRRTETPAQFHEATKDLGRAPVSIKLEDGTEITVQP